MMTKKYKAMLSQANSNFKNNFNFLSILKQRRKLEINKPFQEAHEHVFSLIDCLECANCCEKIGPKFIRPDIDRIAKYLNMKPGTFTSKFLQKDEDNDIVLQQLPCPFLNEDNRCSIYEVRPRACKEYPHTNHNKMQSVIGITILNLKVCPAVSEIVQLVKKNMKL